MVSSGSRLRTSCFPHGEGTCDLLGGRLRSSHIKNLFNYLVDVSTTSIWRQTPPAPASAEPSGFPDAGEPTVLRAWYSGLPVRQAVARYLPARLGDGKSTQRAHRGPALPSR